MDKFSVYGCYDQVRVELYSHKSLAFATRWAEGYTRNGLGGYDVVEVVNGDVCYWQREAHDPELEGDLLYEDDGA